MSTDDDGVFGVGAGILTWVRPGGPEANLWPAVALAMAGVVGALTTLYLTDFLTDGERVDQLGGALRLRRMGEDLDTIRRAWVGEIARHRQLLDRHEFVEAKKSAEACEGLRRQFNGMQRAFRTERRSAIWRWGPLFVILAGVLALAFAHGVVEAAAIGAAWLALHRRERNRRAPAHRTSAQLRPAVLADLGRFAHQPEGEAAKRQHWDPVVVAPRLHPARPIKVKQRRRTAGHSTRRLHRSSSQSRSA